MKSSTAFALAASFVPFAIASPYHLKQHAERVADANFDVAWVTDVEVATTYVQVTEYYTGPPAVQTTVVTATAAPSFAAKNHDQGEHHWTWEHTTAAAAQTTTVVAPAPVPTTSSEEVIFSTVVVAPSTTEAPVWNIPAPTSAPVVEAPTSIVQLPSPSPSPAPAPSAASADTGPGPYEVPTSSGEMSAYIGQKTGDASYSLSSGDMQAALLNSTNTWRSMFQAAPLQWDMSLQNMAADTAKLCAFEHSNAGQNLAAGYSGPEGANEGWAGEYKDYNFASPDYSESAGHFTQVVWQDTTHMGCAAVNCPQDMPAQGWYLVCNYLPVGNMLGTFAQNVKPKAS